MLQASPAESARPGGDNKRGHLTWTSVGPSRRRAGHQKECPVPLRTPPQHSRRCTCSSPSAAPRCS
eukprot:15470038-Alexandrium_andersonii.AAC.1